MACSSSLVENGVEEESEISKLEKEARERRAILDNLNNVIKEFELFDMNINVSGDAENEEIEEVSVEECSGNLNLTLQGIKFFNSRANCDYDPNSIKAELNVLKHYSELNLESLTELKDKVLNEYIIENSSDREQLFRLLINLLFTSQPPNSLKVISEILILLMRKSGRVYFFLDIIIALLPAGLKNIGGNATKIFRTDRLMNVHVIDVENVKEKKYNPVENIRYAVDLLQYSLKRAKYQLKGKLDMPDVTVDNLIFTLITVSQDPQIFNSNVIPSIQNCLAETLDIYPDFKYLKKIQDIVEGIILYWQDSFGGFSHQTSYKLCSDVIPFSSRGKQLKASLAYSSLNFCLPSGNLTILDKVSLYQLSKFCSDNVKEFSLLDCETLYSVLLLMDVAIVRPVNVDNDKVYMNLLLSTVMELSSAKSSTTLLENYFSSSKFHSLVNEITVQWNKILTNCSSGQRNIY